MILYPAVDIKGGQCVRLKQGVYDAVTVFSDDPVAMGAKWVELGAKALHVVDLDGAFDGLPVNRDLVAALAKACPVPVQLGGGIRDLATARSYIEAGVQRLIIGTMALADPARFEELAKAFPGQVGVSLDAVDGKLKTKGWVEDSGLTVADVIGDLQARGAAFVIYTDISRDGMQTGANVEAMRNLCRMTDLPVIAAGGVTDLRDVVALAELESEGLAGIISGKAIYAGTLDFKEAQEYLNKRNAA